MAEREGFEPSELITSSTVFETVPFNHSGISPRFDRVRPAGRGGLEKMAEREGFEPSVEYYLHTRFPIVPIQPALASLRLSSPERKPSKKACRSERHSASRTPPVTSMRWLKSSAS